MDQRTRRSQASYRRTSTTSLASKTRFPRKLIVKPRPAANHATIRRRPPSRNTAGSQPSSSRARAVYGQRRFGPSGASVVNPPRRRRVHYHVRDLKHGVAEVTGPDDIGEVGSNLIHKAGLLSYPRGKTGRDVDTHV